MKKEEEGERREGRENETDRKWYKIGKKRYRESDYERENRERER